MKQGFFWSLGGSLNVYKQATLTVCIQKEKKIIWIKKEVLVFPIQQKGKYNFHKLVNPSFFNSVSVKMKVLKAE